MRIAKGNDSTIYNAFLQSGSKYPGSGEAKGFLKETIRGKDIFLLVDVCNNSLEYKMQLAGYLLRNEKGDALSESDTGTLDCSHITQSGEIRPVFSPDAPLPQQPAPAPENQPEENGQG